MISLSVSLYAFESFVCLFVCCGGFLTPSLPSTRVYSSVSVHSLSHTHTLHTYPLHLLFISEGEGLNWSREIQRQGFVSVALIPCITSSQLVLMLHRHVMFPSKWFHFFFLLRRVNTLLVALKSIGSAAVVKKKKEKVIPPPRMFLISSEMGG